MPRIRFVKVRDVKTPRRSNEGDAGLDFYFPEDLTLEELIAKNPYVIHTTRATPLLAGEYSTKIDNNGYIKAINMGPSTRLLIPSGLKILLEPKNSMMQANNKSGRASKQGLLVTSTICDSPYTGEYHLGILNTDRLIQTLEAGKAISQFIHIPVYLTTPEAITMDEFDKLEKGWGTRGEKGIGSGNNN